MKVTMIRNTYHAADLVGQAAALCTNSDDWDRARRGAMASGHMSVAEHASYTFLIEGVSRALLAQITRHRIASFSVQSQRYVAMKGGFPYVIPPSIEALGEDVVEFYKAQMEKISEWYDYWLDVLGDKGAEDARFVLPNACETNLVLTMNARELDHFFSLRCCNRAQWEIRELADRMLEQCREIEPELFRKAGPGCVRGKCPEGKMSCGRPRK